MQQHYSVYLNGDYVSRHKLLSDAKKKAVRELEKYKGKGAKAVILSGPNHPFKKYDYEERTKRWSSQMGINLM
jgi:hypothetical protein